ncbi:hypothetical protein B5K08_33160 [Rhizobium leguminosarum bv. trifolii]|nr:hypothetical protein B5K08_33160 [Rhizobium leguminosarum bv. trifolii]
MRVLSILDMRIMPLADSASIMPLCDGGNLSGRDPWMSRCFLILILHFQGFGAFFTKIQYFSRPTQGKLSEKRLNPEIASCLIAWG